MSSMRSIYRKIAKEHGVSVKEVKEEMQAALNAANVPEKARGETLSPEQLATLSDVLFDLREKG